MNNGTVLCPFTDEDMIKLGLARLMVYKDGTGCVNIDFDPPLELSSRFGIPVSQHYSLDVKDARDAGYAVELIREKTQLTDTMVYPLDDKDLERLFPDVDALTILAFDWMKREL